VCKDDIYALLNKNSIDIEQCNTNDKVDYNLSLCDNAHSNNKIKSPIFLSENVAINNDNPNNVANNSKVADDNNIMNGKSLTCTIYLHICIIYIFQIHRSVKHTFCI